jgi:hypothetical protein
MSSVHREAIQLPCPKHIPRVPKRLHPLFLFVRNGRVDMSDKGHAPPACKHPCFSVPVRILDYVETNSEALGFEKRGDPCVEMSDGQR